MQQNFEVLKDVEMRLSALADARRLRSMVAAAGGQLQEAKGKAVQAESGSYSEQQYLKEAAEASERLAALRESLYQAERELRRTDYLLDLLSE
jgi:hypothetical protein